MRNIKQQIENDGYAILEDFLSEGEVDVLKSEGEKLLKNMPEELNRTVFSTTESDSKQNKEKYFLESWNKISYFYESDALGPNGELKVDPSISLNKIGHALHILNPNFKGATFDERIKESCYQLGFEDPVVVQSMYIFKNPGIGSEVVPHQDASYLYTEPVKVIGFWIALEDATLDNGCLWFAKGSHKSGVHRRYVRNPDKNSDELLVYTAPLPYYQKNNFTPVPVKKGTCILIHGQVVHSSEPNKSDKSRHAYTFHVIEQKDTKYAEDNWIQPSEDQPFPNLYKN